MGNSKNQCGGTEKCRDCETIGYSGGADTMKPTERNLKTNTCTINAQLKKK